MQLNEAVNDAVEILQQLGLKEYEARCFVALSQLSTGTAKQVAELADIPRTRVYDTVRVLEARGLVEVQHTSPRRFRTVRTDEAIDTLRNQYEGRIDRLSDALERSFDDRDTLGSDTQEIWSLAGADAISNRAERLIDSAQEEVLVVASDDDLLSAGLLAALEGADAGVDIVVGTASEAAASEVRERIPGTHTYDSEFDWLTDPDAAGGVAVGTVLLVDQSHALVSTALPDGEQRAVTGTGYHNGVVVLLRRIVAFVTDR